MHYFLFLFVLFKFSSSTPSEEKPKKNIYINEENKLKVPSHLYYDQEAFALEINYTAKVELPFFSLNQFCIPEKMDINIQNVATLLNYESYYRNPEFIMIDDYLIFIDLSQILRVFQLDETTDSYLNEIYSKNISEEITSLSFLRIFYNSYIKEIYLLIDNIIVVFSIKEFNNPSKIEKIVLDENPNNLPIQAVYENNCFYLLMDDKITITVYCFDNQNQHLKKKLIFDRNFFSNTLGIALASKIETIQDLIIDKNVLIICEKNIGIIFLNTTDKNNIILIFIDKKTFVNKISLFENSLLIVRSHPLLNNIFNNYLEEYFIDFSKGQNFDYIFNRNLTLSDSQVNSLHISRKFVFILQDNQIKIYRHSIPKKLVSNDDDFMKNMLAKDILVLERAPNMGKNDLIIAVFGSKIILYQIMELSPTIICKPPDSLIDDAYYQVNFLVFTKKCKYDNDTLIVDGYFSYCSYSNSLDVFVNKPKFNGVYTGSITTGVIIAISIAGVLILIFCVFFIRYYGLLKEKFMKLKELQYQNITKEDSLKSPQLKNIELT